MIRKRDFEELLENLLTLGHWVFLRPFPVAGHIATANQLTVTILKFSIEDFTDLGLLKIRRTVTGLSLWFCLHKCSLQNDPKILLRNLRVYLSGPCTRGKDYKLFNTNANWVQQLWLTTFYTSYDHGDMFLGGSQAFLGINMAPGETAGRQYFFVLFKRGLWFVNIFFKNGGVWLIHRAVLAIVSES